MQLQTGKHRQNQVTCFALVLVNSNGANSEKETTQKAQGITIKGKGNKA